MANVSKIHHELAHGTPEGFDILLRPLRWEAARVVAALMTYCMYAGCAFVLFREPTSVVNWFAASALVWAGMWRSSGVTNQNFIAIGSSEALADSVALAHPDFLREDRWRQRAMSLLRRLLDEAEGADRTDPKSYAILARIIWLKRSIRQPIS